MEDSGDSFSLFDYLGLGLGESPLYDLDLDLGLELSELGEDLAETHSTETESKSTESVVPCLIDNTFTAALTLPLFQCSHCDRKFHHRKSLRRHQMKQPHCGQHNIKLGHVQFDMEQFSKTLRANGKKNEKNGSQSDVRSGKMYLEKDLGISRAVYRCQVCGTLFSSQDKLQIHTEELQGRLQCCYCSKILGNRAKLKTHHRSHTRQRPFQCEFCENSFTELSSLRKHILTHGPRRHQCHRCEKAFVRSDYLKKHINSNVCNQIVI